MTRQEVEKAFLIARDESVQHLKPDDVKRITRFSFPRGENPFDGVNLRIAKGELSTGDTLKDFIVMEYGIDCLDDMFLYYQNINERINASSGELIAVATRGFSDNYLMKEPINPRKEKSWIEAGIIQDGIDIKLQSGGFTAYPPGIEVKLNGFFHVFFPMANFFQKKEVTRFPNNKALRLGKPNFVYTGGQKPDLESPIPEINGTTIAVGNNAVEVLFEKARAGKVLREAKKLL